MAFPVGVLRRAPSARACGRKLRRVWHTLPRGRPLPEEVWQRRHRAVLILLGAHAPGVVVFALFRGFGLRHSLFEGAILAAAALAAATPAFQPRTRAAIASVGLLAASAVLVHISGGYIEFHFHFFVMVGVIALYQQWLPFLLAIGFVVLHHGIGGAVDAHAVYNHPGAWEHPWRWAALHGAFIVGMSIASLVAWRLNEQQALHDPLTKLPNRALFWDRVDHALRRSSREGESLAVLFIDVDTFKAVNDGLGHGAGDAVLDTVGRRIAATVREPDTVARLGGDEFAVLLEPVRDARESVRIAERVAEALREPVAAGGTSLAISASIGISVAGPMDVTAADELIHQADVAMYAAKQRGRGGYELFQPAMRAELLGRIALERDLERALERDELVLHYQPIVSVATGEIVAFEALLRWQHPERGLLSPAQFIDLAEDNGLMIPIGRWTVREASRTIRGWQERFPGLGLTVNLSAAQLQHPDVVDEVAAALRGSGLPPETLMLEITEHLAIEDPDATIERLAALKLLGVRLALDDFGTGYSSLSRLHRLPVDVLKIDRSFIPTPRAAPDEARLATALVAFAASLGLEIVAEGVEHPDQLRWCETVGCDGAQGYHVSPPVAADAAVALLATARSADAARVPTAA